MQSVFKKRHEELVQEYNALIRQKNSIKGLGNGIVDRYKNPVLTPDHVPLFWRYDLNEETNPYLMERFGINAVFNAGAIKWQGKYLLAARIEGKDRKSFFAIAESVNGIDNFTFWQHPMAIPENDIPDGNIYDIRLVAHEDGWVYGIFCTERKDPNAPLGDESSAVAQCGVIRSKDLKTWQRLPDIKTSSPQQRNIVLHPEFVNGKYALYTRPQDSFLEAGKGGGIALGYTESMDKAVVLDEVVLDYKQYHTINELKNGQGPAPLKTEKGWLHLAHGVRNTAAGLRYVLYLFITALDDIERVTYKPAGYFLAPEDEERIGDVSNVLFSNGWVQDEDGRVLIYYASSDTRMHVAVSTIDKLLDYCVNTGSDGLRSATSVQRLNGIIRTNAAAY